MFVFGTVIGYKHDKLQSYVVYNISLVQKGGSLTVQEARKGFVSVIKVWKSGIDFLKQPNLGGLADNKVHHSLVPITVLTEQGDGDILKIDDDGVFDQSGFRFGLEICLDHANQVLKNLPIEKRANMHIQLVPACGMSLQSQSVCVKAGGVLFLCDGLSSDSGSYGAHSEAIQLVQGNQNKITKIATAKLFKDWKIELAKLFSVSHDYEPRLSIYSVVAI